MSTLLPPKRVVLPFALGELARGAPNRTTETPIFGKKHMLNTCVKNSVFGVAAPPLSAKHKVRRPYYELNISAKGMRGNSTLPGDCFTLKSCPFSEPKD